MRIQSIAGLNPWGSRTISTKETLNYSQPNFEATITVKELKKLPLDKKLSHLFASCSIGDLVAVGKNFDEVYKGLSKSIANFSDIIKRILFIRHGGLSVPLAFNLDSDEEWGCVNIGDKKILISSEDSTEDLDPDDSIMLDEGDIIINNNVNIPIGIFHDYDKYKDDNEDMELITNPENFATRTFDLEDVQQSRISHANKTALALLKDQPAEKDKEEDLEQVKESTVKKLSFKDVGGMDKTIETLKRSVLYPIKFPFAYENVSVNKGILLYGKPGTGKTLLAEALAGESNAEFLKISGTDFESKWIGETEKNWRELFSKARENQPSIIFIDEFDAVVKERGRAANATNSDKVVNQILSLMSDLEKSSDNVFVIATTNKPETIDSAIMRSGRFGKHIEVVAPDRSGLEAIFDIHTRNKDLDSNLDKEKLLDQFVSRQFTGADIKHIVNEAHTNSWLRAGIYEKMDAGTLQPENMKEVSINEEDFMLAIADWDKNQTKKTRKLIGFNK